MAISITHHDDRPDFRVCVRILRLVSVWKRFSSTRVFSIDPQAVFTDGFIIRVKDLILVELNIANCDDLTILWDPDSIDVAALIANEIANVCPRPALVGHSVLVRQNLVSDGIGSTALAVETG